MHNVSTLSRKTSASREERISATAVNSDACDGRAYDVIKLGIDVHTKMFMTARQMDNATPQPPQKMSRAELLKFIERQLKLARRVICCYEAGCFGFGLQRQIIALGGECLVIAPQKLDERNKRVNTDRTDAAALLVRLDRYVAGNTKALAVVRTPSLAEEVERSRVRQRAQFLSDRNRQANRGKSLLLLYGMDASWSWWKIDRWDKTVAMVKDQMGELSETVLEMLKDCREILLAISQKLHDLTRQQQKKQKERMQKSATPRLRGIGELSMAVIEAEVGEWKRFNNRRQVASYTGLCPGVSGTGGRFDSLSINKCGNRRLRSALVELAWLLPRYQSGYLPLQRWKAVLSGKNRAARKKAIVALARQLAVDLWRINTAQTTPEKLGLKLAA